jgi:hypothetical protein
MKRFPHENNFCLFEQCKRKKFIKKHLLPLPNECQYFRGACQSSKRIVKLKDLIEI